MSTRSTHREKLRAGRAGTALLGAAALALIPSYFVWNWMEQTKPFPDENVTADADPIPSDKAVSGGAAAAPMVDATPNAPAPPAASPDVPPAGPALNGADGSIAASKPRTEAGGSDASVPTDDQAHDLALSQATASRERQILRAYRPTLPSVFQMRQWTANDGAVAYATYLGRVGADVMLEDETGKKFRIPRDRLSEQDQELLRSLD